MSAAVSRPIRSVFLLTMVLFAGISCGTPLSDPAVLPTAPVLTATPLPTQTPAPPATPTPPPTPEPTADPAVAASQCHANELGWVLVLEYHLIEEPEARWSRSPDNFRSDIERLIAEGYYPINLIDLAVGHIDVPAGKSPVVLTFDDSSSGQFRYLEDGTVDPDCAVGILLEAAQRHPDDWRPRATFFVLLDVDVPDRVVFGQPEWADKKLQDLASWGMEIGSHTISHFVLSQGSPEEICWQLAVSENQIEAMAPGFEVRSLSVPLGEYPTDMSLIQAGVWQGQVYDFEAAVQVAGGASPSPFSVNFDPYRIRRTQAIQDELDYWLGFFRDNPEVRYVSDGYPDTVAIPSVLPERLQGLLRPDLPDRVAVIQYDAQP